MINALLKLSGSRCFIMATIVGLSGLGVSLLFLAAIGFYYGMVPYDALDRMTGQPEVIRWLDETTLGIPTALFYSSCSLLSGLVVCAFAVYAVSHLPASTHEPESRNA